MFNIEKGKYQNKLAQIKKSCITCGIGSIGIIESAPSNESCVICEAVNIKNH